MGTFIAGWVPAREEGAASALAVAERVEVILPRVGRDRTPHELWVAGVEQSPPAIGGLDYGAAVDAIADLILPLGPHARLIIDTTDMPPVLYQVARAAYLRRRLFRRPGTLGHFAAQESSADSRVGYVRALAAALVTTVPATGRPQVRIAPGIPGVDTLRETLARRPSVFREDPMTDADARLLALAIACHPRVVGAVGHRAHARVLLPDGQVYRSMEHARTLLGTRLDALVMPAGPARSVWPEGEAEHTAAIGARRAEQAAREQQARETIGLRGED